MSAKKSRRNAEIYRLKKIEGWSDVQLISKFKISPARIRFIVKREEETAAGKATHVS